MKNSEKAYRLLQEIGEIPDCYLEEAEQYAGQAKTLRRTKRRKLLQFAGAAAACAVLLTAFGTYRQSKQRTGTEDLTASSALESSKEESIEIANLFISCASLDEAAALAGFSMTAPDSADGCTSRIIQAIEKELIEVLYFDESETERLRIRKSVGTEPNSGDYIVYDRETTEELDGYSVTLRGNDSQIMVAQWTDGTYSYSIRSEQGISLEEIKALIPNIQ